jgi:23S rRNA (uracil1939-C5)-methyltransferase
VLLAADYQLQKLAGVDMFPHTAHLELMALFSRQ